MKRTSPGRAGWAGLLYFAVLPPAAAAGGLFLAPWMSVCALIGTPFRRLSGPAVAGFAACALPLAALAGLAAFSMQWSIAPPSDHPLKIALVFASGLLFVAGAALASPEDRKLTRNAALAGLLVLAALLTVEALFDMPLNRWDNPNAVTTTLQRNPGKGASVLVALVWGGLGMLMDRGGWRRPLWQALFAVSALLAFQFGMNTNLVAFLAGAIAFVIAWQAPKIAPALAGLGIGGWMIAAPFASHMIVAHAPAASLPLSWQMRLSIWDFTLARIAEKPWLGWGIDASRMWTDRVRIGDFEFLAMPLHPHSASLHVWLELGAAGAVLAGLAIIAAGFTASRTLGAHRGAAAAATASAVAIGAIWNVSYGAWQEWWMVLPFAAAALAAALRLPNPRLDDGGDDLGDAT